MYCLETIATSEADAQRIESLFFRFLEEWSPADDEELYLGAHTGPNGRVLRIRFSRRSTLDSFRSRANLPGVWEANAA